MIRDSYRLRDSIRRHPLSVACLAAGLAVVGTGCTTNSRIPGTSTESTPSPDTTTTEIEGEANVTPNVGLPEGKATNIEVTFDDLGAGSSVIRTYQNAHDNVVAGTYYDGESVTAECWEIGLEKSSDPSIGEEDRTYDEWVRFKGPGGVNQWATLVYLEGPENIQTELIDCETLDALLSR